MPAVPGFIGPSYTTSKAINSQRCINLRLEIDAANGKAPLSLVGLPGYRTIKSDLSGEVRGFWKARGRTFVVIGSQLIELSANMTHKVRGGLTTSTGRVSIADNGLQMLVVDGNGVLGMTLADNGTTNSIGNFPVGATFVLCIDNTMLANEPKTQRFHISAVGDGYTWSALDFASAEGLPDDLVAMVAFNKQAYLIGTDSMQVFWDSGDATRPFIPLEGSLVEVGCGAPDSAVKDKAGVYWLTPTGQVYKAAGNGTALISTPALRKEFAAYRLDDARAFTFELDNHDFYVLTFPSNDRTWLYDATTQAWHEWLEWDTDWHRHRANCAVFAFGKLIVGDMNNGRLYEMSSDIEDNDGRQIRALRASAHISQDEMQIEVNQFEVVCQQAVGLTTGQGSAPQMMLRCSKDGGNTWGREIWRSMGLKGEYRNRTRWATPCGVARDLVFEVSFTDPVKRVLVKAVLNGAD